MHIRRRCSNATGTCCRSALIARVHLHYLHGGVQLLRRRQHWILERDGAGTRRTLMPFLELTLRCREAEQPRYEPRWKTSARWR